MKKIFAQVIFSLLRINFSAHDWIIKTNLIIFDIQKAFNDYWATFKAVNGEYINANDEKVKAMGWKQVKIWELNWVNRINPETSNFPIFLLGP